MSRTRTGASFKAMAAEARLTSTNDYDKGR